MPTYRVYLMRPYMEWTGVEADNEEMAIKRCDFPPEIDLADGPWEYKVEEEEGDDCFILPPGQWRNPDGPKNWWAVGSDQRGIIAYFETAKLAEDFLKEVRF